MRGRSKVPWPHQRPRNLAVLLSNYCRTWWHSKPCQYLGIKSRILERYVFFFPRTLQLLNTIIAQHHGLENSVIYASKKFCFWQNRPYVRTSAPSCWRMFDMHVIILTAVKIRLIKLSCSFWYSSVRRLRKLYFLKILLKVPMRASLLAFGV